MVASMSEATSVSRWTACGSSRIPVADLEVQTAPEACGYSSRRALTVVDFYQFHVVVV